MMLSYVLSGIYLSPCSVLLAHSVAFIILRQTDIFSGEEILSKLFVSILFFQKGLGVQERRY